MTEIHRPTQSYKVLLQRLQSEIQRYQNLDMSPSAPLSTRINGRQVMLDHINTILSAATNKTQARTTFPNKFNHIPILKNKKIQQLFLKLYNFLFKEQRAVNLSIIQSIQESARLSQQLSDQIVAIEISLQKLNTLGEERLKTIETQLASSEEILSLSEHTSLGRNYSDISIKEVHTVDRGRGLEMFYHAFEDRFRGTRSTIRERLCVYLPILQKQNLQPDDKILDLGCGRGEWLELLQDRGYQTLGLDLNQDMLAKCQELGLSVLEGDALVYLKSLPDNSLGAITGFHIVEHLPFEILVSLLGEAQRVVRAGGVVIFETPNPRNILVGSCTFYLDPTHNNPIPPEALQFMVSYAGFESVEILPLNPSEHPRVLEDSDLAHRFNELFYGSMDYAAIGYKS